MGESKNKIRLFEQKQVRAVWDEEAEKWWFSIIDVVAILTESIDPSAYWRKLKQRLASEGNETVTNCHGLKLLGKCGLQMLVYMGVGGKFGGRRTVIRCCVISLITIHLALI